VPVRRPHIAYHLYNNGGVTEWLLYQPASGTSSDFRIGRGAGGVISQDCLVINGSTGVVTVATAAAGTNNTQVATTAFVRTAKNPVGQNTASTATLTPTFDDDFCEITAQAAALNIANPTGTAVNMWGIVLRIKDNGTARAITYGTQYRGIGVTLPNTTVLGKTLVMGMIYNSALTKWDVINVSQE
jgi:hypothetical protein